MGDRRNLPLLIGALWVAEVTGSFETAMILAALKRLIEDFGNPAMVGWLITGYLIVGAAMTVVLVLPPAASPGRPGATVLVVPGLA